MSSAEDRLAIREVLDGFADAVSVRDPAAFGATWAEDALWFIRGGEIIGRPAIVAAWLGFLTDFATIGFFSHPGPLDINGDQARCMTQVLEFLEPRGGPRRAQVGIYDDRLIRRAGIWQFAARRLRITQGGHDGF